MWQLQYLDINGLLYKVFVAKLFALFGPQICQHEDHLDSFVLAERLIQMFFGRKIVDLFAFISIEQMFL